MEKQLGKLSPLKSKKTMPKKISKHKNAEPIKDYDVEPDIKSSMNLSRAMLKEVMGNLGKMRRQAKAIRKIDEKGDSIGFKLVQVSPNSLFETIGLRNDDVIQAVNGFSVTSPYKAMLLFNALKHENKVVLSLLRQKKNVQITYEIE